MRDAHQGLADPGVAAVQLAAGRDLMVTVRERTPADDPALARLYEEMQAFYGRPCPPAESVLRDLATLPYGTNPTVDDVLDHAIVVVVPTANPEGRLDGVRRNSHGFDLNKRDLLVQSQPEVRFNTAFQREWLAPVALYMHGVSISATNVETAIALIEQAVEMCEDAGNRSFARVALANSYAIRMYGLVPWTI